MSMGQEFFSAVAFSWEMGWYRSGVNGPFTLGSSCRHSHRQLYNDWEIIMRHSMSSILNLRRIPSTNLVTVHVIV